jgi:WD40 repeat protein
LLPSTLTTLATGRTENNYIRALIFSVDGNKLGIDAGKDVRVWDLAAGKVTSKFQTFAQDTAAAFSPDLTTLALAHYQDVDLLDVATGKEQKLLPDHRGQVGGMAFTADGKTLAVGVLRQVDFMQMDEICLWDVEKGEVRKTLGRHLNTLWTMAVSPNGKWLALINRQGHLYDDGYELRLLDVAADRIAASLPLNFKKEMATCLAFSPDSRVLAAGYSNGTVRRWDLIPPPPK